MSWTDIDDALIGTPCASCRYKRECDYAHDYRDCELAYYDEDEESWELI